jgi:hypothetical protein
VFTIAPGNLLRSVAARGFHREASVNAGASGVEADNPDGNTVPGVRGGDGVQGRGRGRGRVTGAPLYQSKVLSETRIIAATRAVTRAYAGHTDSAVRAW